MPDGLTNFVYVVFGDEERFFTEAAYSIGTVRRWMDPQRARIIVFTDHPERVRSWPVTCVSIAGQTSEMRGPSNFGLRIKLCCLLQCAETFPDDIVFIDSDTFIRKPMARLSNRLKEGCALMHRRDSINPDKSPFKNLRLRLPDGRDYSFGKEACMFNSGVIGFRHADAAIIKNALAICDAQLLRGGNAHITEQLALSEAMRVSGRKILEADDVVGHYYRTSAKKYMRYQIATFAKRLGREPWDFPEPVPCSYLRIQWFKLFAKAAHKSQL